MHDLELYSKYRRCVEELANKPSSLELSLMALHALLQQFEREAIALDPATAQFKCDEITNQLEHEALRSANIHRRVILLAAVKGFEDISFSSAKP